MTTIDLTPALRPDAIRFLSVDGERIAFRRLGPSEGTPLVLFQRFRGTLGHWDPLLLAALSANRPVVVFDSLGVGRSSGTAPEDIHDMADFAAEFLRRLGHRQADILGWSMGGAVAQSLSIQHAGLVRTMILAGTGPGGVPDAPPTPDKVWAVAGKPVNDDDDFLYLFFPDTPSAIAAGRAHLARLAQREIPAGPPVKAESVMAQLKALGKWARGHDSAYAHLPTMRHPALVANGVADIMVHPYNAYVTAQRMPRATLILYPDAGHGFLFQHARRFARDVDQFIDDRSQHGQD